MLRMYVLRTRTFVGKWDSEDTTHFRDVVEFQTLFNPQQGGIMLVGTLIGDRVELRVELGEGACFEISKDSPYWKAYFQTSTNLKSVN